MKTLLFSLSFFLLSPAFAEEQVRATAEIPEFHQVSEGIFRGGHPTTAGLEELSRRGVKLVINLENDEAEMAKEREDAARLGLQMINKPLSMFWAPSDSDANEILALLADPSNRPVFIHCTFGQDRTGLMIGLYRVLNEQLAPAAAYSEMLNYGFKSKLLFSMDRYFRTRTGLAEREFSRENER